MIRPKTIREVVYEQLKNNILAGVYRPGERLIETNLAQDLEVSRTPIRDALNKLESEGLVETLPHRRIFVTKLSRKNILDFYQTRAVMEGLAAKLAAENATEEELADFHSLLNEMEVVFEKEKELTNYKVIAEINNEFHSKIYYISKNEVLRKMLESLQNPITLIRSTAWTKNSTRKYSTLNEHRLIASAILQRDGTTAQKKAEEHIFNAWKAADQALEDENASG
ncbi:GntR family transcriptional regulator [Paenibacillus sp. JMULE4]|uniref:GntR family transcriptional regulator n=1 Tax=Paenibacillus sp. JMULE4 TaxID=2518342 RepID=UPI00157625BE|nr:GntR family transcriptional regulator [Paenibacillus sp. JMULE4]NTZ17353.1 GntR family transcriptional regulator [Paenibacillus sp. JMULE4]